MDDWEEAAMFSKKRKAVARFGLVKLDNGKYVKADIIKGVGKDGVLVYTKTARTIRKATTREVDSTKGWKPW